MMIGPTPPTQPRPIPNSSRPDGVVLTSTQTRTGSTPQGTSCAYTVFDAPEKLPPINVPVYVVANRSDKCPCTPHKDVGRILNDLTNAPVRQGAVFPLDGSPSPMGPGADACSARTPHGFWGIEDDVVASITTWVKAQP
jgi:hypothetical protein